MLGDQNKPVEAGSTEIALRFLVNKDHKLYHFLKFIDKYYGHNPENILKIISSILDIEKGLKQLRSKNKWTFKNLVSSARYFFPAAMYSTELVLKIKNYISTLNEDQSDRCKREKELRKKIGWEEGEYLQSISEPMISMDILEWFLKRPETKGYKILDYLNNQLESIKDLNGKNFNFLYILIEIRSINILLEIRLYNESGIFFVGESRYVIRDKDLQITSELSALILKDFILSFNIKENILRIDNFLFSSKRTLVQEKINQFNMSPFIKEIRKVLKYGRRKSFIFVGRQGTGKTVILRKLEEILTDEIIVRLSSMSLKTEYTIKKAFQIIRSIQPAIVIIEDIDSCDFEEKNERLGTFINEIDDSNNNLNIVLIMTVNDTKRVNNTLIDRPGRTDEIIEIKSPQTILEVYEVMFSKFNKLKNYYTYFEDKTFPKFNKIDKDILNRCLKEDFTQADISNGVIEKMFLNVENIENINYNIEIKRAIEDFMRTKNTLKNYSFNKSLNKNNDYKTPECDMTAPALSYRSTKRL